LARRGQGLVVPLLTATLALAALVGGWVLFRQGSPGVTTPPERSSEIYVVTDDPGARIHLGLTLTLNFGELYPGRPPPLDLTVRIRPSRDTPLRWAIVLNEGARLPWPAGEPAGTALPRGERRAFSDVWVEGDDVQEAWFVRNASGWLFRDPDMRGSVLFGTGKPAAKGRSLELKVTAPTDGPLVLDAGESYSMYLPSLGVPGVDSPAAATAALARYRDPVKLMVGGAGTEGVPGALKDQLERTAWRYPVTYTLDALADNHRFEDRLVQVSPPPVGPTIWRWHGTDRLLIQAFAERPSWTARAQRLQFLAGVLTGLGGGFLIWSLELWHGVLVRPGPEGG